MKILLIQLPLSDKTDTYFCFPLGLGYIASTLLQAGHEVEVIDLEISERHYLNEPEQFIKKFDFDLIAISGFITGYFPLKKMMPVIKKLYPEVPVILGGPIITGDEALIMEKTGVDFIVKGEGEATIIDLLTMISGEQNYQNVAGIYYRQRHGEIVYTGSRPLIADINTIPFPAWHLFEAETYLYPVRGFAGRTRPQMVIIASRGCPASCNYCNRIYGKTVRLRSPENIIQEIKILKNNYGVEHFYFVDQTMTVDINWLYQLCHAMAAESLDISWMSSSRLFNFDEKIYDALKESGCNRMYYGVETGSKTILRNIKKSQEPALANKIYRILKDRHISMHIELITGDFYETEATMKETAKVCMTQGYPGHLKYLTPLPGTPLYEEAKTKGLIKDADAYLTSISDGSWTCDYETLLLNLTRMSDAELVSNRNKINADMQKMSDLRGEIGIFGENLLLKLLAYRDISKLLSQYDVVFAKLSNHLENISYFKENYDDLYLDIKYYEHHINYDYSIYGDLKLKGGKELTAEKGKEILHYFYQRYGIFAEKLLAKIITMPKKELINFVKSNMPELLKAAKQDIVLFNFIREKFSGDLIPLVYTNQTDILKPLKIKSRLISMS